jgi:hypothetical protein
MFVNAAVSPPATASRHCSMGAKLAAGRSCDFAGIAAQARVKRRKRIQIVSRRIRISGEEALL